MGMTIAEKIIAAAAGVDSVKPGDIHTVQLDRLMSNDGTTHLTVDMYNNKLKNPHIADTKKLVFIVDHNVPSDCPKTAASQKKMRDFAKENNIDFWEGKGVCHQVMIENYVRPGELIFGADSHTCSYGALGAFGTGVGCTDFLYGMVTGTSWVLVPESVKFNLTGKLPEVVTARDLILTIIGEVGANGCNYQVMEFTGEGAKTLSISDRMTLCNMAVEAGAKTGIFEADEKAMEYLKEHGREPKAVFHSDPDAKYVREIFTGVYASDFGIWNTNIGETIRHQRRIGAENVKLLFNIVPEAARYLADRDIKDVAKSTIFNNRPDALCVSGLTAGSETDSAVLKQVKDVAGETVIFANTGVRLNNVEEQLSIADGAVVGTTFKYDGKFENHVDKARVKEFMDKVKQFRSSKGL